MSLVTAASAASARRTGAGMTFARAGDGFAGARRRFGGARFMIVEFLGRLSSIFAADAIVTIVSPASADADAN